MMIDTGPKVYSTISRPNAFDFKVKVTDLEIFNANVFKSSYFPNHMMDWVYI